MRAVFNAFLVLMVLVGSVGSAKANIEPQCARAIVEALAQTSNEKAIDLIQAIQFDIASYRAQSDHLLELNDGPEKYGQADVVNDSLHTINSGLAALELNRPVAAHSIRNACGLNTVR